MARILIKHLEHHKAQFPELSVCIGQKSILHHYYIKNDKDRIQSLV